MKSRKEHYSLVFILFSGFLFGGSELASAGAEEFLRFRLGMKQDSIANFEGFSEFVSGEDLHYFSHRGPNSVAHLARAGEDRNMFEWKTAVVPTDWRGDQASFVWIAGIGAGKGSRNFQLFIEGKERFIFSTRADSAWTVNGIDGGELNFVAVTQDAHGDLFGYMKLTVPANWLTPGKPLTLKIAGEKIKSEAWVMVFKFTDALSALEPIDKEVFYTVRMRNLLISAIDVISPRLDWAAKTVSLVYGKDTVGQAILAKDGETVKTRIRLAPHLRVNNGDAFFLTLDGKEIAKLDSREYARQRLLAFLDEELEFSHKVFSLGGEFPKPTWKRPGMVDNEMGEFDLKVTYYDANYNRVEKAEKPGRYGAVVEAVLPDGYHLQRYVTLFCGQDRMNIQSGGFRVHLNRSPLLGLSESVWNARQETIDRCMSEAFSRCYLGDTGDIAAILMVSAARWQAAGGRMKDTGDLATILAGVWELGDKSVKHEYEADPFNLDRQWWVGFKRRQFGVEEKYPSLKLPVKIDTVKTTVLHEGDPACVGYSMEQIENIRRFCREWVREGKEPISVLVARKGVIVFQEAFGEYPDDKKITAETPTWMASVTKLLTGCLMMQFVDQGLINLDDPVSKYLPELDSKVETPLTIRHLFTHTSGFWGHGTWGADWNNSFENVVGEYLPYLEVARKREYNGIGYTLAGKVMERVSGKALPFLFQEQLFGPLDNDHTFVQGASGDTRSICMDMAKVAQMLLNRGSYGNICFFSRDSFDKMMPIKLDKLMPGSTDEWGIGLTWATYNGVTNRTIGHGTASGAVFQIDPKNELVIICCRNQIGLNYFENVQKFMRVCTAPFNTPATVPAKK